MTMSTDNATATPETTAAGATSSKGRGPKKGKGVATKTKLTKTERNDKYTKLARERKAQAAMRRRGRNLVCFGCRQHGHAVGQCPQQLKARQDATAAEGGGKSNRQKRNAASAAAAVERCCYKCGSTDHAIHTCPKRGIKGDDGSLPFAACFICNGRGHLSRSCPQNSKGIYVNGGACKVCGSTQHLSTACTAEPLPKEVAEEEKDEADYSALLEGQGDEQGQGPVEEIQATTTAAPVPPPKRRQRVVQF
jgi:zinc finger CCHC domain-containing protein 9